MCKIPDRNSRLLIITLITLIYCGQGCATLQHQPLQLFSWHIPRNQIDAVKETIVSNGYLRISRDNYRYEGAFVTQYQKEIMGHGTQLGRIRIMMSFKDTGPTSDLCRNFGLLVINLDRIDVPEIDHEMRQIETVLYDKLLMVSGKENVARGERGNMKPPKGKP